MVIGILSALLACALWGFAFLAPKLLSDMSPVLVTAGRYTVYATLALCLSAKYWQRSWAFARGTHGKTALGLSIMSNTVYFWFMSSAVQLCGPAITGVIIGTIPVWVSVLGRTVHTPLKRMALPLFSIIAGIVLINYQTLHILELHQTFSFYMGIICAMLATICWTAYAYLNAQYLQKHPDIGNFEWTNLLAFCSVIPLPVVVPLYIWYSPQILTHTSEQWVTFVWVSILLGVGASWVASYLWNMASRVLPTALTGQMIVAETVFVLVYDFIYSARWPTMLEYVAITLCCVGILVAIRMFNQAAVQSPAASPKINT